jgi:LuxR family maltose regulon positive regulatory protein
VVIALHRFKRGEVAEAHATARAGIPVAVVGERAAFLATVAHLVLGVSAYWRGEHAEALEALSRARALAEDDENRLGAAYAGGYLGLLAQDAGDHATATDEVARCRALAAAEPGVAEQFVFMVAHLVAAREALAAGTPQAALGDAERALELSRRGAGRVELAAALLVAAEACGRESGGYRLAEAAALLGTHGPAPLVRKLEALRSPHPRRAADSGEALSPAELAVLRLLPSSLTQREIGSELFLSLNTIKTHTRRIMAKLDARSREEAVAHARQQGLL